MSQIEKIENAFCNELGYERNTLKKVGDTYKAMIVDVEMDTIEVTFNYDGCVTMDVSKYQHIVLSSCCLETLIRLTNEAEESYENEYHEKTK